MAAVQQAYVSAYYHTYTATTITKRKKTSHLHKMKYNLHMIEYNLMKFFGFPEDSICIVFSKYFYSASTARASSFVTEAE